MSLKQHIPNSITLGNLAFGCVGIVMAFDGNLNYAVYCIWLAMFLDFFDGFAARLLNVSSPMGKELDSLADLVSFGVLPSAIIYQLFQSPTYLPMISFLIALFSALRLAKFNIDTNQENDFIGLPTPANALFISSMVFLEKSNDLGWIISDYSLMVIVIIFSLLLVSPIRLFSLKLKSKKIKDNKIQIIFLLLSVSSLFLLGILCLPLIILLYIVLSLVKNVTAG